jgi:hypothetical protein
MQWLLAIPALRLLILGTLTLLVASSSWRILEQPLKPIPRSEDPGRAGPAPAEHLTSFGNSSACYEESAFYLYPTTKTVIGFEIGAHLGRVQQEATAGAPFFLTARRCLASRTSVIE